MATAAAVRAEAGFLPNSTSIAIMKLVHGYFRRTGKPWAYIDQRWLLDKLEAWYGVKIARSTLNYNLRILRKAGIFETMTRHHRDPHTGEFIPRVTMYKPTPALRRWFAKLANYFKRCGWTPSVPALAAGHMAVVGAATTRHDAWLELNRQKKKRKRRGG